MRVISRKSLKEFATRFPDAEARLDAWFYETKKARWHTPADIKGKYQSASILKNSRVVFNICGNKYRLIVSINYRCGIVFIRFVGTHEDYDKINAEIV